MFDPAIQRQRRGAPKGSRNALKHGLYAYRAMLNGGDLDQRTSLYHALREKENELIIALGGDPSPQQRIIIADTIKHLLFAGSLDRYLLSLKSLVRKGKLHSVVAERTRIGAHIRENLKTLGLNRISREISLHDMISDALKEPPRDSAGVHVDSNGTERG